MTAPIHPPPDNASRWTTQTVGMSEDILIRMERAVAKVRERLLRATAALNQAGVPYAVVGGNAVASWVATVDEGAVRNTRDVDLLVRRIDLRAITTALEKAGFVPDELLDVVMFRDGPEGKPSEAMTRFCSIVILSISPSRLRSSGTKPIRRAIPFRGLDGR